MGLGLGSGSGLGFGFGFGLGFQVALLGGHTRRERPVEHMAERDAGEIVMAVVDERYAVVTRRVHPRVIGWPRVLTRHVEDWLQVATAAHVRGELARGLGLGLGLALGLALGFGFGFGFGLGLGVALGLAYNQVATFSVDGASGTTPTLGVGIRVRVRY